jgi:hypothetical protein
MYEIEQKICSKNAWFTPQEALEYYGRFSREGITLHGWGGNETADKHDNIVNYFLKQAEAGIKSPNYVLSDNKITCMVDPDMVAWCSTKGNPTTISIECQPNLGDEGYKRLGWLIKMLEGKYDHRMSLYPHKYWQPTSCPMELSIDRARQSADGTDKAVIVTAVKQYPAATPVVKTAAKVFLPAAADTWRFYKEGVAPVKGNEYKFLRPGNPAFAPGLTYDILGYADNGNTVIIQTQDFGRGKIWITGTSAQLISGAAPASSTKSNATGKQVILPKFVDSWRAYPLDVLPRVGNERGQYLLPSKIGHDLVYDILDWPYPNVVTIDTESYDKVNIYVGADTEARFA